MSSSGAPDAGARARAMLGPLPFDAPDEMLAELAVAYATPPRAYHTLAHAAEVLGEVRRLRWAHPVEVALAALYHDAVYVVGAADNERQSATLALRAVDRWLSDLPLDRAFLERLIVLTAEHGRLEPGQVGEEEARFLDCDMAILGAPPEVYDAYERGVAEEYAGVYPFEAYRVGRAAFLAGLLARPQIFLTDPHHERLDARARANLARALAACTNPA